MSPIMFTKSTELSSLIHQRETIPCRWHSLKSSSTTSKRISRTSSSKKIENYNFTDVIDANIGVKDIIDFTFNLTDWKISNLKLDNKTKLMQLLDGRAIFQFSNFTGNLKGNYWYVSDPPILADIGVYEWNLNSTSFKLDSSTNFNNEESLLNFTLNELDLEIDPFKCDFQGLSDISNVASRLLTFGTNVIRGRINSIVKYAGKQRLQPLINTLIGMIPDVIDIPGTTYEIEGGISDDFEIKKDAYFLIPLDISMHNKDEPYIGKNNVSFGQFVDNGYQMQFKLSEYLLQSVIHAVYQPEFTIATNESIPGISTTTLDIMPDLFGKLTKNGFERGQPCILEIKTWGDEPVLDIKQKTGLHFDGQIALPLKCKKKEADDFYSQVFTIISNRIQFTGLLNITENLTIKMQVADFDIKVDHTIDSQIGDVGNLPALNVVLNLLEPTIKGFINLIFGRGISLQFLLNWLHLNWVDFSQTLLNPFDGYFIMYSTPIFHLDQAVHHMDNMFTSFFQATDQTQFEMDTLNKLNEDFHSTNMFSAQEKRTIKDSLSKIVNHVYQENSRNDIVYI